MSSSMPEPQAPVYVTGGGRRLEIDLQLDVHMQKVNRVVGCALSVILNSNVMSHYPFELRTDTLINGCGLRYQVVCLGLEPGEELGVVISWLGGGTVELMGEDEAVVTAVQKPVTA